MSNNMLNKKAVLYARYSSDLQTETSIEAQTNAIQKYCDDNGIKLIGEYIDRAKSGTTTAKRTEFNRMIEDSKKREFDYVIVHKLDRFARDRYDSAIAKHELRKNRVSVLSVTEHIDDSPESKILEALLEAIAEYYSRNLGREVLKGFLVRARKSLHTGGIPPLGYNVDTVTNMLVINEQEAVIVRDIFERYVKGQSYVQIIRYLNSKGYRTKLGNEFNKNSLHDLIRNKKYAGYFMYNVYDGKHNRHLRKPDDEIVCIKGGVPAIISEEIFNKAEDMMMSRKHAPGANSAKVPYLLSGLVRCGECGAIMTGNRKTSGKGVVTRTYRCEHKVSVDCHNKEVRTDRLEEFVLRQLEKYIFREENIPKILEELNKQKLSQNSSVSDEVAIIEKRIKEVIRQRDNIVSAIASGCNLIDFKGKLDILRQDEELLNERKATLQAVNEVASVISEKELRDTITKFSKAIRERDTIECKRFIKRFIKEVRVYENRVEVTLRVTSSSLWGYEYAITKSIGRSFLPYPGADTS